MKHRSLESVLRGATHPNAPDAEGRTPLHWAAHEGRVCNLQVLLDHGGNVHLGDNTGEQPLQMAARKCHLECVQLLIKARADINYIPSPDKTEYSESALCSVARAGWKRQALPVLMELLGAGANPNTASSAQRLPLHEAAECGNIDMVRALLTAGAKIDVFDYTGQLPLHRAVSGEYGNAEVVSLLLASGSDVNIPDKDGIQPIFHVINHYQQQASKLMKALLAGKPDLTVVDSKEGKQPLAMAESRRLHDIAALLREAGAPQPAAHSADEDVVIEEDAEEQQVELRVSFKQQTSPVKLEDTKLAAELSATLPSVAQRFGWRASFAHWCMLESANKPCVLSRMAYFTRGHGNRPPGKEFEDGPRILGESYQEALNRFISEGLIKQLDDRDQVILRATVSDCKLVAKQRGIKLSGTRNKMIDELFRTVGPEVFASSLTSEPLYIMTPLGAETVASKDSVVVNNAKKCIYQQIFEALLKNNLKRAGFLFLEIDSLTKTRRIIRAEMLSEVRAVLENPIPDSIQYDLNETDQLRAIAAACELVGKRNQWADWASVKTPTDAEGEPLNPRDFAETVRTGEIVRVYMSDDNGIELDESH